MKKLTLALVFGLLALVLAACGGTYQVTGTTTHYEDGKVLAHQGATVTCIDECADGDLTLTDGQTAKVVGAEGAMLENGKVITGTLEWGAVPVADPIAQPDPKAAPEVQDCTIPDGGADVVVCIATDGAGTETIKQLEDQGRIVKLSCEEADKPLVLIAAGLWNLDTKWLADIGTTPDDQITDDGSFAGWVCPPVATESPAAEPPAAEPPAAVDPNAALACPPNDGEADFIVCIATPGKGTTTIADLTAQGRIILNTCDLTPEVMTHQGLWTRNKAYLAHTASTKPEQIMADGSYAGWRCAP